MPSPTREAVSSIPSLLPPAVLYPTPSPGTTRTLRKLQSAHNLGAKAGSISSILADQRPPQLLTLTQTQTQPSLLPHDQALLTQQPPKTTQLGSPVRRNASVVTRSPQRARSNSDATNTAPPFSTGAATPTRRPLLGRSPALDALSLDRLIRDGPPDNDVTAALNNMRWKILETGIKSDGDGMSSARIYAWLILLDCPVLETDAYLALIHRGASPAYSKIRNDTFRTLTTDPLFRRRVSEASLIRLLNAIAWKLHDSREQNKQLLQKQEEQKQKQKQQKKLPPKPAKPHGPRKSLPVNAHSAAFGEPGIPSASSSPAAKNRARALTLTTEGSESSMSAEPGTYVQGMNVLAAPFLYAARSEAEAFVAFHQLLTKECPGYIRGAMDGVHRGLALVDKVLAIVDSKLSLYLLSKNLSAKIYAFPSVLTLCACTPPLPEVLRLWDFLFAYGPHLNILCIVAQLMLIRNQILTNPSPNKLLRSFPALQADAVKNVTLTIIRKLPADVYSEIVTHAL